MHVLELNCSLFLMLVEGAAQPKSLGESPDLPTVALELRRRRQPERPGCGSVTSSKHSGRSSKTGLVLALQQVGRSNTAGGRLVCYVWTKLLIQVVVEWFPMNITSR